MRSCPACGTANGESDDFCGNCGGYLGWSSQPVRPARTEAPEPDAPVAELPDALEPEAAAAPVAEAGPAPEPEPAGPPRPATAPPEPDSGPSPRRARPAPAAPPAPAPAPAPAEQSDAPARPAPGGPEQPVPASSERPEPPARPEAPSRPAPARPEQPSEPPRAAPAPPASPAEPAPAPVPPRPATPPVESPPVPARPHAQPVPPVQPAPVRPGIPASAPASRSAPENVSEVSAADEPVGAVRPAKPVSRRPVVRPVAEEETPDGPPCPACGTPNLPGRKFCRRCAAPLQAREQPAALPWWRTVWPFRRRVRGGSGRALRRTLLVLVVAGLLFAGFALLPMGRYLFEDVRDKLGGTAEISPTGASASASAPGHPAGAAIDGLTNKYWGAPELGASLTCSFETPFRLVGVVVHTGVSKEPQEFRRGARPTRADLLVTTKDGTVHEKAVTFNDKPGEQTVRTGISDVVSVELVLREAAGQGKGRPIAVGEVEFFKRT